ncbi:tRNA 2-selenouridine(34) synthase MnmH [Caulobacter sp. 17J65-9]|uniref:tRNA 2-selenouridine(34) synthase MnmH n=1 Tax=Caulobacter sp. 17J65-9 TaxID=2709382 RepID=UPI0013C71ACB|nr:tRNA 2-selenouridine(34) synthase MnmH [Caulobacter sp. 17J65-9]NEX91858.1 tRNA 2-selenouridine(34) synthase MnmH [Caulobacter sp. 17J65-9]
MTDTIHRLETIDTAALSRFDAVIDVRSPGEFAEDHLPGAENLPVLDDAQRAEVGTIYVQESKFRARRLGAAHVARNIAAHLDGALADRPSGFQPLVYCWRGGQRSHAMATILSQVGWRTTLLVGGYRTWRRHVTERLYGEAPAPKLVLLDGGTGTAKTEILGRLAERGVQTLDLEGLAAHRGSLLGALPGRPQPGQKLFESRLLEAMERLDPSRPVLVEAESSKIGEIMLPPVLWRAMQAAPRIEVCAPTAERATYLAQTYRDLAEDQAALYAALSRLPRHHSRERLAEWRELADTRAFSALAEALIEAHYDPAYRRSSREDARPRLGVVTLPTLDPGSQERAADAVAGLVDGWRA